MTKPPEASHCLTSVVPGWKLPACAELPKCGVGVAGKPSYAKKNSVLDYLWIHLTKLRTAKIVNVTVALLEQDS